MSNTIANIPKIIASTTYSVGQKEIIFIYDAKKQFYIKVNEILNKK